jgi:hypothetical protein
MQPGSFSDPVMRIIEKHPECEARYLRGDDTLSMYNSLMMQELYTHFCKEGEMPYGTMKARTGDPDYWILEQLDKILGNVK